MRVTVNIPQRVVRFNGNAHYLSRIGCMIVHGWLQDNGRLLWGWSGTGEYVFEVTNA